MNPELRTQPLPATHVEAGTGHQTQARDHTVGNTPYPSLDGSTRTARPRVARELRECRHAGLKILLLSAIVDTAKGGTPSVGLDLLVTGVAVGAGTKPLHDLVSSLQKSSQAKSDAAASS